MVIETGWTHLAAALGCPESSNQSRVKDLLATIHSRVSAGLETCDDITGSVGSSSSKSSRISRVQAVGWGQASGSLQRRLQSKSGMTPTRGSQAVQQLILSWPLNQNMSSEPTALWKEELRSACSAGAPST